MQTERLSPVVSEAAAFARGAWRRLWAVQGLAMIGAALVFLGLRGRLEPAAAYQLATAGWLVSLAAWAPLWAGAHRLALGGPEADRLGPGGLQFDRTELRFLALGVAAAATLALAVLALVALSAALFVVLRGLGFVDLPLLGAVRISFMVVAACWTAGLAGLAYAAARFALAPAATTAAHFLILARCWRLSHGGGARIAGGWLLAQAPLLLLVSLLALIDPMVRQEPDWGLNRMWPLPEATVAGLLLGLVYAFVQAPLTAGVLAALYSARGPQQTVAGGRGELPLASEPLPLDAVML